MGPIIRGLLVAIGVLSMLGGLGLIVATPDTGVAGLYPVALGAFLVVIPLIERQRYRSLVADKANDAPGPGGGETPGGPVETRFRPTSEVFDDPTSGHRMRVLVDPETGERRYVAEA